MIIEGKPELGLQKHQQEAYSEVVKAFETDNRAAVVIPTGCGKSFISLQLMEDNRYKNLLFLAPTKAIREQMFRYIVKYVVGKEAKTQGELKNIVKKHFPNLRIMLYPTLWKMGNELLDKLKPDYIVMDELHRTGAEQWGEKVDILLQKNPNSKVLGLTATPDRTDEVNVVDKLFSNRIEYELTLVDAIRKGIVKPPKYVKCDYALGDMLENVRIMIEECEDEKQKVELQEKFEKMRRILERADGIPQLFEKNMTKKDGKYIVFCKDKKHMDEIIGMTREWFGSIDNEPEIYSVYSGEGYSDKDNISTIKQFEESKSKHLKLLFSIDMLNEGLHVDDISGVIMLRPTESRILYLQQLGRTLSSDTTKDQAIVFDLVNNYLKNNLDREINSGIILGDRVQETNGKKENDEKNDEYIEQDIDIFRIQGETKELLELYEEVLKIKYRSTYLKNARDIKKWMEERGTTKPPSAVAKDEEEKRLGRALFHIRQLLIKPYINLRTEEEKEKFREKYPYLEEVMQIVNEIDEKNISIHLINAREIKKWMQERGTTKPPKINSKDEEEKRLATALGTIRKYVIKPYMNLQTEEEREEYRQNYPYFDEVMEIIKEIDENNLSPMLINAREIKKWMEERGTTKPPRKDSKDKEEKRLGNALKSIRQLLIKPYMNLQTEEEREEYRQNYPYLDEVMEIIKEIDENNLSPILINAREIKKWMEERGTTIPPSSKSKNEEEKRLGNALRRMRESLIKPYMNLQTEEEREKFREENPYFDEVMQIINEIDNNKINISKYLINARDIKKWMEERGTTTPPKTNSKDEEEKRLGKALLHIRDYVIKPYRSLKTEKEREEYKQKYPYFDEVMEIVNEIDKNNVSRYLINAREIKRWMEERGTTKPPKKGSKDEEEKRLGNALNTIRTYVIKPYMSLKTEEEREKFREENSYLDEVMQIIIEIDFKGGNKKQEELAKLMAMDLEQRGKLQEALELKARYEQLLKEKQGEKVKEEK